MINSSIKVIINDTLEDGAWKDSFDKLLEPRPILRAMNLIKQDVRASFNMNSSIENCSKENSEQFLQACRTPLGLSTIEHPPNQLLSKTISTPLNHSVKKPFKCTISPIGGWQSIFSEKCPASELQLHRKTVYNASLVNPSNVFGDLDQENSRKTDATATKRCSEIKESTKIKRGKVQIRTTKSKAKRKASQKHVSFEITLDQSQKKESEICQTRSIVKQRKSSNERAKSLLLQPGKWRKSLNLWRRTQVEQAENRMSSSNCDSYRNTSVINLTVGRRKSVFVNPEIQSNICNVFSNPSSTSLWQQRVLYYCLQNAVLDFSETYNVNQTTKCRKIGEGAYGEVFLNDLGDSNKSTVLKIIPIEGSDLINGEVQKTYEQMLPEIVISMELSKLSDSKELANYTCGFVDLKRVVCVQGNYPKHFLRLWADYDNEKGSENDDPTNFSSKQMFIVLELSYGGQDLEAFIFTNSEQSYYALQQVILTLAVGEMSYNFEHRDLHWGNILITNTTEKNMTFKLEQKTITVPTKGVKTTIIDYTLSRMRYQDFCLYNDLSNDQDLYAAEGDYQFDIYRMMRDVLKNNWEAFEPKTNIFWISYLIKKMLQGIKYRSHRTKTHALYVKKLMQLEEIILDFSSTSELAKYLF